MCKIVKKLLKQKLKLLMKYFDRFDIDNIYDSKFLRGYCLTDRINFYANSSRFSETLGKLLSDGISIYDLIDELPDIDKNLDKLNIRQFYMFNKPFCDDLNDERLSENYKELL